MKKQIQLTILFAYLSFSSLSQTEFHNLDFNYNINAVYPEDSSVTQFVDIDNNGQSDLQINSWFGHLSGTFSVIEVVTDNLNYLDGFVKNQCTYLKECSEFGSQSGFLTAGPAGYIYNTGINTCISLEGVKSFPFSFLGSTGVHQAALYVDFLDDTITIRGVGFNRTPDRIYDCAYSLSVDAFMMNEDEFFTYYNLLGQEVTDKKGMLIEVSSLGRKRKVFFP